MPGEVLELAGFCCDCMRTRKALEAMYSRLTQAQHKTDLPLRLRMALDAVALAMAGCKLVADEYEQMGAKT